MFFFGGGGEGWEKRERERKKRFLPYLEKNLGVEKKKKMRLEEKEEVIQPNLTSLTGIEVVDK